LTASGNYRYNGIFFPLPRLPKDSSLEFLIFRALVFLFPVAAYCLYLAMLNSRDHPTMVSGPWDFVGVLLATSGFLVFGGPTVLAAFYGGWRNQTVLGIVPFRTGPEVWYFWLSVWFGYLVIILLGSAYLMRRRRNVTVIYNIDPTVLDQLLVRVAEQFSLACRRVGNRLSMAPAVRDPLPVPSPLGEYGITAEKPGPNGEPLKEAVDERRAGLELEPFQSMCHVTLRWQGDASLRHDVEAELERELRTTPAPENPSAGWFLTVASSLFGLLFLGLVAFLLWRMRRGP
jgi:hypothetical protein